MSLKEIHLLLLSPRKLEQGTGEVLFGEASSLFLAITRRENRDRIILDVVLLGCARVDIRIDKLDGDPRRCLLILV